MTFVLLVGLVAAGVVIFVLVQRQRAAAAGPAIVADPFADERPDGDPRHLRVGDLVRYHNDDWMVRGSLFFDQDGYRWAEHLIDNAKERRWLSVEDDEGLELVLWDREVEPGLDPGPRTIDHDGVTYTSEETGRARFEAQGATGTALSGAFEYHDYVGPGDLRLGFERYGETSWELVVGRVVSPGEIEVWRRPETETP